MRYIETNKEDLYTLMKGLEILEHIDPEITRQIDVCLYALTEDEYILDVAKDAIAHGTQDFWDDDGESTVDTDDVTLAEVGLAIPLSADNIYALLGSGLQVNKLEFVYKTDGGEGVRSMSFYEAEFGYSNVKLTLGRLTTMALADTDSYLDEFFSKESKATPAHIEHKVHREAPATAPEAPQEAPEGGSDSLEAPPPAAPQQKQTSQKGGIKLRDLLEGFLG